MGKKLSGMLNLSKLPKDKIFDTKKGEKGIFIDIVENKNGADKYGNTHSIQVYDKESKQVIYLGNLKEQEFGSAKEEKEGLPF